MDKIELEIKQDENTINYFAEKLELVSNNNMVTKEELLRKPVSEDVIKNKMITVAGQMFIENEKKLDNSNQIFKRYEDYIGDNKYKNDIIENVCGDNVKDICSARDGVYKSKSIYRFIKVRNTIECDIQTNKELLW